MKDETESLIRKDKLTEYRCYGDRQVKGEQQWEHKCSRSPRLKVTHDIVEHIEQQILGIVEKITRGFVGSDVLNNTRKRYLQAVMNAKHKKKKRRDKGAL